MLLGRIKQIAQAWDIMGYLEYLPQHGILFCMCSANRGAHMLVVWTEFSYPVSFSIFSDCPDVIYHIGCLDAKLSP